MTEIAAFVGLAERLATPVGLLPYGVQKRVELARALCMEPRLLLLDEPVAGMSGGERRNMAELIIAVRESLGISILLVEHDMGMVMRLADAVTVLDFGRRIADGPPRRGPERPRGHPRLPGRGEREGGDRFVITFLELLANGISVGTVYALIALGFVIIFKATEVVNFAHASLLLVGGFVIAKLHASVGFWLALLLGIAGAALVGALIEFLVIRRANVASHSVLAIVDDRHRHRADHRAHPGDRRRRARPRRPLARPGAAPGGPSASPRPASPRWSPPPS